MKKLNGFEGVKESGKNRLAAGGYVCRYTKVEDVADKEYLAMEFDIAEGEFAGYFAELSEKFDFWGGRCIRSYKEKALPMFKRMCNSVMRSNPGYVFNPDSTKASERDEKTLVGKLVGIVLQEEEYNKNNGEIGTRLIVAYECDAAKIRNGEFKVPDPKKLPVTSNDTSFLDIPNADGDACPFD